MTQGSSYPQAGIKIGQTPAHRLSTPSPKLAADILPPWAESPASTNPKTATPPAKDPVETAPTTPTKPAISQEVEQSGMKQEPASAGPEQPSKDSNEVEVTTSDQISEHGLPTNGRSSTYASNGAGSGPSSSPARGAAPDRRTAMGVASVRIAGRLTQNELGSRTGDIRTPDTSVGPDELLQLLGEYLTSGGLQNPEIHVRSNGQTIVLDLLNPAKGYR
ncbi:hypothetical protein [Rhodococcus sp. H29-C3]|uniref:hypothetical protein n=1 Tax=Rhodococcus sp. H29-C3 TaxID=3046307 RepID=UPI0024BB5D99|nr:hypothetical protein [Rhodococcus sp. H29-C3]MDJ0360474.1 hypothetical protein [Rhodococcus sp. H29-C3]